MSFAEKLAEELNAPTVKRLKLARFKAPRTGEAHLPFRLNSKSQPASDAAHAVKLVAKAVGLVENRARKGKGGAKRQAVCQVLDGIFDGLGVAFNIIHVIDAVVAGMHLEKPAIAKLEGKVRGLSKELKAAAEAKAS